MADRVHSFIYLTTCLFVYCNGKFKSNEQTILIFLWLGPDITEKKLIFETDLDHIMDTKKILNFKHPVFNVFAMTLAFWLPSLQT